MKFFIVLALFCSASVFALRKDEEGTAFPESWYEDEAANAEDDGLDTIPHFMDAEEDLSAYFGESPIVETDPKNILQVAYENGATIFVKAAILVGLKDELSNHQDITAFVPSNRAFARMPKSVYLYFLRHPKNLRGLLKYHVVKGTFMIDSLVNDGVLDTLLENFTSRYDSYTHTKSNRTTQVIQGAHVNSKRRDLVASNGVVHVIDDVIIRLSMVTSYEVVSRCPDFSTLYNALIVAGMTDALKSGSLTVFAPTQKAFKRLPPGVWEKILSDKTALTNVLDLHVVSTTYFARGFRNSDVLESLNKAADLTIHIKNDRMAEGLTRPKHDFEILVNDAKIVSFDGVTTTGIIQPINKVLIPPSVMEKYNIME